MAQPGISPQNIYYLQTKPQNVAGGQGPLAIFLRRLRSYCRTECTTARTTIFCCSSCHFALPPPHNKICHRCKNVALVTREREKRAERERERERSSRSKEAEERADELREERGRRSLNFNMIAAAAVAAAVLRV